MTHFHVTFEGGPLDGDDRILPSLPETYSASCTRRPRTTRRRQRAVVVHTYRLRSRSNPPFVYDYQHAS